jgi:SAM-dependent methyltransferase
MNCICCGSQMEDKGAYLYCNCRYARLKTVDLSVYDADYASRAAAKQLSQIGVKLDKLRLQFVRNHLKPKRLLDIGCATGHFVNTVKSDGIEAIGYDINPIYGFTDVPKGTFDAVTLWDTIEHADCDPLSMIEPFLDKKGMVFISLPSIDGMPEDITMSHHFKPEHIHYFSAYSLSRYLIEKHYLPIEINYAESFYRNTGNPKNIMSMCFIKS